MLDCIPIVVLVWFILSSASLFPERLAIVFPPGDNYVGDIFFACTL